MFFLLIDLKANIQKISEYCNSETNDGIHVKFSKNTFDVNI